MRPCGVSVVMSALERLPPLVMPDAMCRMLWWAVPSWRLDGLCFSEVGRTSIS